MTQNVGYMRAVAKDWKPVAGRDQKRELVWNEYVQRVASGNQEALATLYDETNSLLYSLALRILGDITEAEEVVLDVYTQVWQSAQNFDPVRGTAAAWLVMLTRSRAIDRLRSRTARTKHEEPLEGIPAVAAGGASPEEASVLSQQGRLVRAALTALPTVQREAIELAYFSGLSHSELVTKLGQPLGTVKTRIRLGMMKLREQLEVLA